MGASFGPSSDILACWLRVKKHFSGGKWGDWNCLLYMVALFLLILVMR